MNALAWTYLAYLLLCVGTTIWVAETLRRYGGSFLTRPSGDQTLGEALTHLLVVGFYLINLGVVSFGVVSFPMTRNVSVSDVQTGLELLSTKVGIILVILGATHFLILAALAGMRRQSEEDALLHAQRSSGTLRSLVEGHR